MQNANGNRQEQILYLLLNTDTGLSIDEMAEKLTISRNAVKQHLTVMEKDQLVRVADFNITGGRPSRNYVLTEQGINRFPKQYSWFCNLILAELRTEMGADVLEKWMQKLGVKLAESLRPQFQGLNSEQRLSSLLALMQSLGYQATIDQNGASSSIKAVNCVYHDLAQQNPELCEFDRGLITTLLEQPIEQTACMANKDCICRFKIKK